MIDRAMATSSSFPSILHPSGALSPPPQEIPTSTTEIEPANDFERFDLLTNFSNHYYVRNPPKGTKNSERNWSRDNNKAIMREWKILARDLPDTILVRAYETRLDLLTVVIIGAAGTPYHDGLFFFDIAFPPGYPFHPPQVRYRSHGFRINPNIYSNGYVCLSLLNTWHGQKKEKWNPKESSLLQVLLSIQALVLNSKPYFNEPVWLEKAAYMSSRSQDRVSDKYNKEVFTVTCKTMDLVINSPPPGFESFVHEHFRKRGCEILRAMEAYANGRERVGFYGVEKGFGSKFESGSSFVVSKKFQSHMKQHYARLFWDFRYRAGASLGHLEQELRIVAVNSKKDGIVVRAFKKLKEVLGLKGKKNKSE